jgi:hypothetical protein
VERAGSSSIKRDVRIVSRILLQLLQFSTS